MTVIPFLTQEELERFQAFRWGSPCERQETIWVYDTILRNAEDGDTRKMVKRMLKVMRRER